MLVTLLNVHKYKHIQINSHDHPMLEEVSLHPVYIQMRELWSAAAHVFAQVHTTRK